MNSIKVNGDTSLINIVIIIVILIFAFWSHNLNVFGTIFLKPKLLVTFKPILVGLFVPLSNFYNPLIGINGRNAIVMGLIKRLKSSVRLWMVMDIF
jgi:hypothetical protein